MIQIKNEFLTVGFDNAGRIVHLENNKAGYGNIIAYPAAGLFKMVCKNDDNWESVVFPQEQVYTVEKDGNAVAMTVDGVRTKDGILNIRITMRVELEDDRLTFRADIENRADAIVVDFMFPRIGVFKTLAGGKPHLLWPASAGQIMTNIGDHLARMNSPYEEYNMISMDYPFFASMQWMSLIDGDETLYFGSHDSEFYATALRVIGRQEDPGSIMMDIVKYPFVNPGECWRGQPFVVSLHTGSWRHGADIYRAWAETWLPHLQKPEWVRDMAGYFLVINKQQYGDILWPYDTLPELWDYAKAHGCDTLGLFGWTNGGHDNLYPNVISDSLMGGVKALQDNIAKVRKDGANVTLYCNGHLMDVTTDYYKQTGKEVESKSLWGTPYYEQYNKYHESEFRKNFTRKTFSTACPSSPEWQDRMCENARIIYGHGPSGVLMDQIGGIWPYPCFDKSHPHAQGKPSLSMSQGRLKLMDRVHAQTQQLNPEYGFLVELITDVYSTHADAVHGLTNCHPGLSGDRAALARGDVKEYAVIPFAEMYHYTFPEVILTVRNPNPYIRPDMANYAFVFGFCFEMELRYLGDAKAIREDRYHEWKEYARLVCQFRKKYWSVLGRGRFIDEEGFDNGNRSMIAKAFLLNGQLAIALWNDTDSAQRVEIRAPGYRFIEASDVNGKMEGMPSLLDPQKIALLLYELDR